MNNIRKNFTEAQAKEFYSLYLGGLSCTQIAKQQGCWPNTITSLFKKYGYVVENRQNKINIDLKTLISEYNSGKSLAKISKEYSVGTDTLSRMLKKAGIEVVNQQNKLRFNENVFDSIDTEEKAYWLGFIFADGCICSHKEGKKPTYKFEITLAGEDVEHLRKFNKFMEHCEDNVKYKPVKYKDTIRDCYRWAVTNKHLWETLNSYGCTPNKSLTLEFPDISIFKDPKLVIHFIRGYFDGDGCISFCDKTHTKPTIGVVGTKDFLNKIQEYTLNRNVTLTKNHSKNEATKVYACNGMSCLAFLYMLYYKSNIYLDRKYNLFLYFKDCRFKAKALKLLEGKIGEGWDANPELIADIKMLQQCNA